MQKNGSSPKPLCALVFGDKPKGPTRPSTKHYKTALKRADGATREIEQRLAYCPFGTRKKAPKGSRILAKTNGRGSTDAV